MRYRKFFLIILIMAILSAVLTLLSPILINSWIQDETNYSLQKVILLIITIAVSFLFEFIIIYLREKFSRNFNINNAREMLLDLFKLDYDMLQEKGVTNILERISIAVNSYYFYFTGDSIQIWSNLIIIFAIWLIVLFQNVYLACLLLVLLPINYFGYKLLNNELLQRSKKLQESTSSGWQEIISVAGQVDYLKQCSEYNEVLNRCTLSLEKIYGSMSEVNFFAQFSSKILKSINQIVQYLILSIVLYNFVIDNTSPISLILFSMILPLFFSALSGIVNANLNKRDMINSKEFIKEMKMKMEKEGKVILNEIHSIDFKIPKLSVKDKLLAENIYGSYKKGDVVWIRGDSGTGKSTLLKLLPRFRTENTVFINENDICCYTNKSLRKHIGYLSQDVPIIKGTLRDNLFLNKKYETELEKKFLSDNILQPILKTKTMDTVINERGSNLSGGEKQKIALLRAIYDNVDVLILDEITSNIDKESSKDIYNKILENSSERITFIVSHDDIPKAISNKELVL